jgi:hypothetical protein
MEKTPVEKSLKLQAKLQISLKRNSLIEKHFELAEQPFSENFNHEAQL